MASNTQPTVPSPPQQITLKFGKSLNRVRPGYLFAKIAKKIDIKKCAFDKKFLKIILISFFSFSQ